MRCLSSLSLFSSIFERIFCSIDSILSYPRKAKMNNNIGTHIPKIFMDLIQAFKLAIPRSLLRGHLIEGRVRETAGFSVEQSSFIPRQLAAGY
jgi:hypothetical protein